MHQTGSFWPSWCWQHSKTMMEESGLAVVILIVTVSDEKCISFSSILISQLCNTLTGTVSLSMWDKIKRKRSVCEHVREGVSGKERERKERMRRRETKRDRKEAGKWSNQRTRRRQKWRKKKWETNRIILDGSSWISKRAVSNLMEEASFLQIKNPAMFPRSTLSFQARQPRISC